METLSPDDESFLGEVGLPTQGCLRLAGPSHEAAGLVQKLLQASRASDMKSESILTMQYVFMHADQSCEGVLADSDSKGRTCLKLAVLNDSGSPSMIGNSTPKAFTIICPIPF